MKDQTKCGFSKWSIGIGDNGEVIVKFSYHPNYGEISLHDASVEDFRNLGEMFLGFARECQKK